ncbi:MAG TPA: YkvA family protein [Pseudolabrys sp.]|nr:YkvA family protein [Pseudolabrys sp.]
MGFSSAQAAFSRARTDEAAFRRQFWRKVQGAAASIPFAEDLLAAYYCAFDSSTPTSVKAALFGALAYFVLPTDAIPDFLPVLGFTDDAAILAAAIKLVADHIRPEHRDAAKRILADLK